MSDKVPHHGKCIKILTDLLGDTQEHFEIGRTII